MSSAAVAAQLISALEAAADREAGAKTALVSVTIEALAQTADGVVEARLTRKTRTLVFMSAEFKSAAGALIVSANSVHKVLDA